MCALFLFLTFPIEITYPARLSKTTHSSVEGLLSVAITTETAARDGVERLVPRRDVEGVPQLLPPSPRALLLMRELMLIRLQNKSL